MNSDTGVILDDLELSREKMFDSPKEFAETLLAKAKELESICKQDTSVGSLASHIRRESETVDVPPTALELFNSLYGMGDDVSLAELVKMIDAASELVADLKNTLRDRVTKEATLENSTIQDKRIAHMQYVRLRKAYEFYRNYVKIFHGFNLPIMPALPGSYGHTSGGTHYMFTIEGEDGEYFNHRAVAKKIGLEERFHTLRDFLDWVESADNHVVSVREVIR